MLCLVSSRYSLWVDLSLSVLQLFSFTPDSSCHQGQICLFLNYSCLSPLTDALFLLPQTGSLICVWLLCGHVHQRCARGQAGRSEDGRGGPWGIVGPGSIRIHRCITDCCFLKCSTWTKSILWINHIFLPSCLTSVIHIIDLFGLWIQINFTARMRARLRYFLLNCKNKVRILGEIGSNFIRTPAQKITN